MNQWDRAALLLTGVYGTGKSSVAAEIADILEKRSEPYAALDLDWLIWFEAPDHDDELARRLLTANLRAVVTNYVDAGVRRFVLAGSIATKADLDEIRATVPAPMTVVRLTVPLDEIERRLQSDVTTGRRDDLRVAATWLAGDIGVGFEDFALANEGPIRAVAMEILGRVGWT
jgi:adenylylsulfate kinase-like enzyme